MPVCAGNYKITCNATNKTYGKSHYCGTSEKHINYLEILQEKLEAEQTEQCDTEPAANESKS